MNRTLTKQILTYVGIVLFFLVLSYGFVPQVLGGKIVNQSDISGWTGMTHEISQHNAAHPDDPTYWTNSMFGGMPTVTMYDKFEGDLTNPLYKALLLGKRPATYLFVALLGAFLLMLSMGVSELLAVGGAIAVAFCSYNMQIIQVGHNTKMQAIAFFPWVLAALIFTYRSTRKEGKWWLKALLGSTLFAFALSFQIKANHQQITWYLAVCVFMYAVAEFVAILCSKTEPKQKLVKFFAASAMLLVIGCIGIATNANKLLPTWEYSKATMRGGSELVSENSGKGAGKGLDLEYATAWSYGIDETPNLMIANFNGGSSSGKLSENSATAMVLKKYGYKGKDLKNTLAALPLYWGPQPFTAGPMYLGAISVFLFVLGLFLYKGREKWWLLAATLFALLLGWGSHAMWFTKLCFDTLPMYNKFRTVSMAITTLQVTVPLLGFVVLDRIVKQKYEWKETRTALIVAYVATAGFCLLCLLIPTIAGNFESASDSQLPEPLADSLVLDRISLLRKDAATAFALISAVAACIYWAFRTKAAEKKASRMRIAAAVACVLVLVDMFAVGKRYLNADDFISPKAFSSQFNARPVDNMILEDSDPDYRVLDLSVNTFNDSHPSYWHKSIGGYSPAKMQRYQDLIEKYISPEMNRIVKTANEVQTISGIEENFPSTPILNMLNTKYVILQDDLPAVENSNRNGNCWFVDDLILADSANEEFALLGSADLKKTAVVRREDAVEVPESSWDIYTADYIRLTSYAANELHYEYECEVPRVAVFSEVYYPGWVSDQVELFRADWTLRAAMIPEGKGEIVMRFEPQMYRMGANVSKCSSGALIALLIGIFCVYLSFRRKENI